MYRPRHKRYRARPTVRQLLAGALVGLCRVVPRLVGLGASLALGAAVRALLGPFGLQ